MIEHLRTPTGWDPHHALYYRRWYQEGPEGPKMWRASSAMIVPMRDRRNRDDPLDDHQKLHDNVPPLNPIASETLAGYALHICDDLVEDKNKYTRLEAFTIVQNEMVNLSKKRSRLTLGKEAARFAKFFEQQLEYMIELPH
jgi:hypothetical protein